MRFLLDTNILIAADPIGLGAVEPGSDSVVKFIRLANEHQHATCRHEASDYDISRNADPFTREFRMRSLEKFPLLQHAPPIQPTISSTLGTKTEGSNEWVDQCMLAAVLGNAVDFMVTDDERLLARASRLNLGDRTMNAREAISLILRYAPMPSAPLPLVQQIQAQALDASDQIFVSVRNDYAPDFDEWFKKCQRAHRDSWIIGNDANDALAAVTIVNQETDSRYIFGGKTLKVCLFKVSESHSFMRYGELLLKAVLDYAVRNQYSAAFLTVFEKYENLISFAKSFGFTQTATPTGLGELVLKKSFNPPSSANFMPALDYHIAYGPNLYRYSGMPTFVVPIQPQFHDRLFPEANQQLLPERNPFGNGIRKAYLCNAGLRTIDKGAVLYFYRSQDWHALSAVGIVEGVTRSKDAKAIARYVGRRTVYSYTEIEEMANKGPVLAILFRQARIFKTPIHAQSLRQAKVWKRPPQSIMRLEPSAVKWIEEKTR